jgi:hypothetical protein
MKVRFGKVVSALSALLSTCIIHGCPMCVDSLGNVDKPFFHEDKKGQKLDEKTAVILSNVHKYIQQNQQEKSKGQS